MRVAFAYRYGALGGVPTQLVNRMRHLAHVPGFEADFVFGQDWGVTPALAPFGRVVFEPTAAGFRRYVEARRFDVVAVIDTAEYLEALDGLGANRPAVLLEIHTTVESGLGYLERSWRPDAYLVPSEYSRTLVERRFGLGRAGAPVHVVPNIVDPAMFHPLDVAPAPERPIVSWVGRLDDHKGWDKLVHVGCLVALRHPTAELWLVGGETAPEHLEAQLLDSIERLGLAARFRWFPKIDYSAMGRLHAHVAASGGVSLVTSRDESFGMAVAEALLCGCPVVSSHVGAIPELAPESDHLRFYAHGDVEHAAALVLDVLEHAERARRSLEEALPTLSAQLSPARVGPRYLDVLQSLTRTP
ncbi:glycosyltransferase family 4 protein [Myxococcota bacterium]|nr:glycosyltransferase family 4 protein [Myxococcota bacterium]